MRVWAVFVGRHGWILFPSVGSGPLSSSVLSRSLVRCRLGFSGQSTCQTRAGGREDKEDGEEREGGEDEEDGEVERGGREGRTGRMGRREDGKGEDREDGKTEKVGRTGRVGRTGWFHGLEPSTNRAGGSLEPGDLSLSRRL